MTTFGELQARIKDELDRDTDPDIDVPIRRSIKDAINFYSNQRLWFLETETPVTTVAGTPSYDLPADWRQNSDITVTLPDYREPLRRQSYGWYRQRAYRADVETGQPSDYAVFGRQIWLYRTPDREYTVTFSYQAALVELVEDTDGNGWTLEAEPLIRMRAKIDLLTNVIREADPTEVALLQEEEKRWLDSLSRRTAEHTMTGRVRPSDW